MKAVHVGRVVPANARHQRLVWRIVQVFGLFTDAIMALILETALDASVTGPFVA